MPGPPNGVAAGLAPQRGRRVPADERGSATLEWALVAGLLTLLFLTVLQIGFALHIRATLIDAAGEGARAAGLDGAVEADGLLRTEALISAAVSPQYAEDIRVDRGDAIVTVTVRAPLPLIGLLGFPEGVEVAAHAPVE
ncbi:TadE/TadG family type IV pilus assembly protein [Gulosibacter sp. 10]|uniref:TadE/TadG family type IV pilus assembly protein n=1 Tax=Gulosibacter sp. 10 TaxID=1255570 RepID=UPI00097F322E|nr:TadE/TadG family type IV pilus assembly protein [Gulosibacter sp. 10]SJM57269.1 putative membrane protein [Gulosibacter sp. 10]